MGSDHEGEREYGRRDVMRIGAAAAAAIAAGATVVGTGGEAEAALIGASQLKLFKNNFRVRLDGVELRYASTASFQQQLHAALEEPDGTGATYTPQSAGDIDVVLAVSAAKLTSFAALDLWFDAYVDGSDAGSTRELAVEGLQSSASGLRVLRTWRVLVRPRRREFVPGSASVLARMQYTLRGTLVAID